MVKHVIKTLIQVSRLSWHPLSFRRVNWYFGMTSTPVSLNDESLNGSWIDINSASQIHSPMGDDSPEYLRPPHSLAESVQNLGMISFQVERFLQEAQKKNYSDNNSGNNNNGGQQQIVDNISDMYLSDSDLSTDGIHGDKSVFDHMKKHNKQLWQTKDLNDTNDNILKCVTPDAFSERLSKRGESLLDQVSDSLSILSRASFMAETGNCLPFDIDSTEVQYQDLDWLWDWTTQPEYFTGKEWKIQTSKQRELFMKHQSSFCSDFSGNHDANGKYIPGEMVSLLFLTNVLSIIIGAGLTYSVLMRRSTIWGWW